MDSPRILVYAGKGSSHSWTWLADLFELEGVLDVRFLDSTEFVGEISKGPDEIVVSGGDGFSIASSLAGEGFSKLRNYINRGGRYVGICAGAYLPLPSSIEPFSEFNVSSTKIENIDCRSATLENVPPRVAVKYGRCVIVHPVRGELELGLDAETLNAPLYGGPIFREPEEDEVLLRYRAFTSNTEFQIEKRVAATIVLGKPAAVKSRVGRGELLLLGPHLEHPRYREANELFLKLLRITPSAQKPMPRGEAEHSLERALADLKVAILGLENRSFVVGKKIWDGSRYLELHAAIAKRAWSLDRNLATEISEDLEKVRCVDNHFQALGRSR